MNMATIHGRDPVTGQETVNVRATHRGHYLALTRDAGDVFACRVVDLCLEEDFPGLGWMELIEPRDLEKLLPPQDLLLRQSRAAASSRINRSIAVLKVARADYAAAQHQVAAGALHPARADQLSRAIAAEEVALAAARDEWAALHKLIPPPRVR